MEKGGKDGLVLIRIQKSQKEHWKKICLEKQISLTNLIIDSVENRIMDNERKKVMAFIEKQDNIFVKIETNINQIAKIVNGQKFISENDLQKFSHQLTEILKLKSRQNEVFINICSMLGK
ncbi:plasmid mobilization relaxosome protein MobC [Chryseobacterium sp. EO14]|uniref:plasmid mobilization relaxosome protein MobC n=1 Tax=Chryseobacterium sp. EO14 TaxID=2950551 RepID=UPI002109DA8C|nr:plasmid mobilization relaxosome protein MobC [Chryseobacterium sp. EO14]MCQ4139507.1 plasmid mobilization relaxosome protein MobC [Chryseobacterium sp. EO14]